MNVTDTPPDKGQSGHGASTATRFLQKPVHRLWLLDQARQLVDFFLPASINPAGGFYALDCRGKPLSANGSDSTGAPQYLYASARMVHCAVIAHQLGLPGAGRAIDHGMAYLWDRHRDPVSGGYFWAVDNAGPLDDSKQAYGHGFVMLAAASAKVVGHGDADRLLTDVTEIIAAKFWDPRAGASCERYQRDWRALSPYRGQNSNMHLVEALMAAFEASGERVHLERAVSIATLIIDRHARNAGWCVPEHYDRHWQVDRAFAGDPMFQPAGTTPGHALEWARLLVQLWELGERRHTWMPLAAQALFLKACDTGWDMEKGGFYYTLDWNNTPDRTDRLWWPCCEGVAAAAVLQKVCDDERFETWYRRIWGFIGDCFVDRRNGGWFAELDAQMRPVERTFAGKPDLYHALQACLIPLLDANGSITRQLDQAGPQDILIGKINGESGACR